MHPEAILKLAATKARHRVGLQGARVAAQDAKQPPVCITVDARVAVVVHKGIIHNLHVQHCGGVILANLLR